MLGIHQTFENPMQEIITVSQKLHADTFQIFTRNNRNMRQRSISFDEIVSFNVEKLYSPVEKFVCHAPYAMNLCTDDDVKKYRALSVINDDIQLLNKLCGPKVYVVHPGSAKDMTREEAFDNLFNIIDTVAYKFVNIDLAVEIMAGAGNQIMSTYEDIYKFITRYEPNSHIGLCFDTCHVYGAGMQLEQLYKQIKDWVKVVHLNNSEREFGSHVDRHAPIEHGLIEKERLINFYRLCSENPDLPIILEVPNEYLESDLELLQNVNGV